MPLAPLLNAGNIAGGGGGPAPDTDRFTVPIRRHRRLRAWWLLAPLVDALSRWLRA